MDIGKREALARGERQEATAQLRSELRPAAVEWFTPIDGTDWYRTRMEPHSRRLARQSFSYAERAPKIYRSYTRRLKLAHAAELVTAAVITFTALYKITGFVPNMGL